jgi:hypothetical protein
MTRSALLLASLVALACGPTTDPYAEVKTEFDDVAAAPKCRADDPTQNCLEARANLVRVDNEALLKIESASLDETTGALSRRLKSGARLDERIKEGTILLRSRKDRRPLLHRVKTLSASGQDVTMTLERVTVKDAFKKGRIRARVYLTEQDSQGQPLTSRPGVDRQPLMIALGPADCSGSVLNGSVVGPVVPGQPTAVADVDLSFSRCRFQLRAWVDAVLEWDDGFANLDKFELSVGGAIDAELRARLQLVANGAIGKQTKIWEGPEIPFSLAGIVITVNPSVSAGFEVSGEATLTVESGFSQTDSVQYGFGYSDRLSWYSIDERDSRFTEFGPNVTFDGRLDATAFITPKLDVKAFGIAGATVTLKTFAKAKLRSSGSGTPVMGEVCRSLDVGVTPAVGAVVEVLGLTLFEETMDLGTLKVALVQNQCTPFTGTVPTTCDPGSVCCLDAQCPVTEPGTTARCKKGNATSGGLFRYRCETVYPDNYCTTDAMCADMTVVSDDRCEDYSCVHEFPDPTGAAEREMATFAVNALCQAPDCCQENSDCAEAGGQKKKCEKPAGSSPSTKGTCVRR